MEALEFRTLVKDGTIELPDELKDQVSGHVRVILLKESVGQSGHSPIDQLMGHPIRVEGFTPLPRDETHE
jgi:hypothetical protein